MYLQEVINRKIWKIFVGFLKVKDENSMIRIHWSKARILGSGSGSPKCHGSTTLKSKIIGSLERVLRLILKTLKV
jgi:hypothetical protein